MKLCTGQLLVVALAAAGASAHDMEGMEMEEHGMATSTAVAAVSVSATASVSGSLVSAVPSGASNSTASDDDDEDDWASPATDHMVHHHHHSGSILTDPDLEPQQRRFWENYSTQTFLNHPDGNKTLLWSHAILSIFAWAFLYPLTVLLSTEERAQWLYMPLQTLQTGATLLSLVFLALYGPTAPDLYPNNAYRGMSIALFFISIAHYASYVVLSLSRWALQGRGGSGASGLAAATGGVDGSEYVLAMQDRRPSYDSGHGDIESASSPRSESPVSGVNHPYFGDDVEEEDDAMPLHGTTDRLAKTRFESRRDTLFERLMANSTVSSIVSKTGTVARIVYAILNRPLFILGFYYVLTGVATGVLFGKGPEMMGLLAHFIKGGVFFLFGLLQLGRYLGSYADYGMAWNVRPGSPHDLNAPPAHKEARGSVPAPATSTGRRSRFRMPRLRIRSMEQIEAFTIFFYGITNVFMEHLGNEDGKWSHKDLQHASIAFMFIGGGLSGLLVESSFVQKLLTRHYDDAEPRHAISFNPMPAFTIFFTGLLMSQHEQLLPLSTQIHMQWGYLLSIGAVFRFVTYIMMWISPPRTSEPSRPHTELMVAFCLICGGMIFMQSSEDTVLGMMYRGLDSMFTLNVNVGVAALIMSYEMACLTLKNWAAR